MIGLEAVNSINWFSALFCVQVITCRYPIGIWSIHEMIRKVCLRGGFLRLHSATQKAIERFGRRVEETNFYFIVKKICEIFWVLTQLLGWN